MDSDDSDFYGDDDTIAQLQRRVDDFDVDEWMQQRKSHPGHPQQLETLPRGLSHLHNPYAGVSYAWQLGESVEQFLQRLPPRTTTRDRAPWIYICNPYISRVGKGNNILNEKAKGMYNEDEAPDEEGSQINLFMDGGQDRLDIVSNLTKKLSATNKPKAVIDKELNKERRQAAEDILTLAHLAKVRAGKWMLFCEPHEVNDVWSIVAKATATNDLGIAAKVAPRPDTEDSRASDRIICIYTKDFRDKSDVGRVLQKLRELKLVEARGRPIYYKPDAFTYVGIASGNPWGLRASIYSSMDVFPE